MTEDVAFSKPPTYEQADGRVVYRASSLGFCPGALVRSRLGITPSPPPENIARAWAQGMDNEAKLIRAGLEKVGWRLIESKALLAQLEGVRRIVPTDDGVQVETSVEVGKRAVVLCHPDGIAMSRGGVEGTKKKVVEAKLLSRGYWDQIARGGGVPEGLTEGYAWQVSTEIHSTGLDALYIVGVKDEAGDWDEGGEVLVFEVTRDRAPYSVTDIKDRVLMIEGYVHRGEMPTCPLPVMWPCPWWKEHEDGPEVESIEDELLASLAKTYYDLGNTISALGEKRNAARDGILKWYADSGKEGQIAVEGLNGTSPLTITRVSGGAGNVSWAKVWDAVKGEHEGFDVEKYRGKPREDSVRVEINDKGEN